MDNYKKLAKKLITNFNSDRGGVLQLSSELCLDYKRGANAITDLLIENQSLRNAANGFKARAEAAEAKERGLQEAIIFITRRTEKAEKIASDLCDDFTDFVTSGIHNAAPYCANRRPECVDGWGWCNVDMKTCLGFYPEAAKKEELA